MTLSLTHETPEKLHEFELEFQSASLVDTSEAALNAIKAFISELEEALRRKKFKSKKGKTKYSK